MNKLEVHFKESELEKLTAILGSEPQAIEQALVATVEVTDEQKAQLEVEFGGVRPTHK